VEPISQDSIHKFLVQLGELFPTNAAFYLLGGCALCLLGNPLETLDIDYTTDQDPIGERVIEKIINQLGLQLKLDIESVPIGEFIPHPPDAASRRKFIGRFGNMDVYIYDLYSIALRNENSLSVRQVDRLRLTAT
jgi:hypothetical protein